MVDAAGDLTDAGGTPLGTRRVFRTNRADARVGSEAPIVGRCPVKRRCLWLILISVLILVAPIAARAADPPAPVIVAQYRTEGIPVDGPFEVFQGLFQFAPTACIPVHTHSGQVVVTVLTGAVERIGAGPESGTYTAGQSWVETAASPPHQACNNGTAEATAMATYLLPKGAPLSNPVAQPAAVPSAGSAPSAPRTGGGGEAAFIRRLGDG